MIHGDVASSLPCRRLYSGARSSVTIPCRSLWPSGWQSLPQWGMLRKTLSVSGNTGTPVWSAPLWKLQKQLSQAALRWRRNWWQVPQSLLYSAGTDDWKTPRSQGGRILQRNGKAGFITWTNGERNWGNSQGKDPKYTYKRMGNPGSKVLTNHRRTINMSCKGSWDC